MLIRNYKQKYMGIIRTDVATKKNTVQIVAEIVSQNIDTGEIFIYVVNGGWEGRIRDGYLHVVGGNTSDIPVDKLWVGYIPKESCNDYGDMLKYIDKQLELSATESFIQKVVKFWNFLKDLKNYRLIHKSYFEQVQEAANYSDEIPF